jgi:hypothetical protein
VTFGALAAYDITTHYKEKHCLLCGTRIVRPCLGAVLVFLPSWQAIVDVYDAVAEDASVFKRCIIYVLHSSLPMSEQTVVFEPAPPGVHGCGLHNPQQPLHHSCSSFSGTAGHMPCLIEVGSAAHLF